ncbi:unnamed protein product (macronuclear) [Paramecium tetraurelia]|uniref:Uncharacterized protein n=1 Tax=Paramecium tetraurelia TaxID=5888 RepID=A0BV76_PARTE|nr:uncharacterized protein GSPATT00005689001 [Paramecium tetraurelia]CAK62443.1 unnamed protein product [Paramecium tetraurelia]|eukprot:XP_001429841.1 hypothetical protein (macronuclear) [Paramecium tetraurelia strain d4-2]
MSLNQQRQQQQQQKLEIQRRLDQYVNAVKDLQNEFKVYYGMLERNDEPNQERFKQTAFKFLKFEKEMNNQIEEIVQKIIYQKARK